MDLVKEPRKLWTHPDVKSTSMWQFMQEANRRYGLELQTYDDLYEWSCKHRAQFYEQLWLAQRSIHQGRVKQVVDESVPMTQLPRWFEGIQVNWAENMLWSRAPGNGDVGQRSTVGKEEEETAVTEVREGNSEVAQVTWGELRRRAARLAAAMQMSGVGEGEAIFAVAGNSCATLVVFLATAWLGGVFSSSSTDMGVEGLLLRIKQIRPKLIFFEDGALYNGKRFELRDKIEAIVQSMRQVEGFQGGVVMARFGAVWAGMAGTESYDDFVGKAAGDWQPAIRRVDFQAPLIINFSSGTTGAPKGIVHCVGTALLTVYKEGALHMDQRGAVLLQFTTTSWIVYLMSVGVLTGPAKRVVLYDGSPLYPDLRVLLRVVEQQGVTWFGTSPRWLAELAKRGVVPRQEADLSRLRTVLVTGMVMANHQFEWFYDEGFPRHVQLCNISGGTDIAGSFFAPNPLGTLHVGGFMGPILGIAISVYDQDIEEGGVGRSVPKGAVGELVATTAFPNMPLYLLGDSKPAPGAKYHSSYFARFQGVWTQGDLCAMDGRAAIFGRSDGVLNPSGVRFGSAEIYAVMEQHLGDAVADSLCVGRRRPGEADEDVVLFVVLRPGLQLDAALQGRIRQAIARQLTKRHVPAHVFAAPEIPMTPTGKKVEKLVRKIISGATVDQPRASLLNPASLDYFYRFQDEGGAHKKLAAKL
ncbi:hypothetical protein CDD81_1372 [Ophiocordyceps australis]|uniref:AMP-dependent synthetase/ligase domain-containing protein n=1 Tax=Ophiocordyceps australis TaxID=1399860 RepID=A0A2C5Y194_9HYPO|nr:hypothetical protein CDD81_1372 [Ophiocordyceps australis]